MKPDWDKLMKTYKGHATTLIADVDCTAAGKDLCDDLFVQGYPTIKYGDPYDLQDYDGERSLKELEKFAKESLGPTCGPANLDLCDDDKKALLETFMKTSDSDLASKIKDVKDKMEKIQKDFETLYEDLKKKYQEASEKKDADEQELRNGDLALLKAVQVHKQKAGKSEL